MILIHHHHWPGPDTSLRLFIHVCPQSIHASGCPSPGSQRKLLYALGCHSVALHVPVLICVNVFIMSVLGHLSSTQPENFNMKHECFQLEVTNNSGLSWKNGPAPGDKYKTHFWFLTWPRVLQLLQNV